jgi:hypothetical protein
MLPNMRMLNFRYCLLYPIIIRKAVFILLIHTSIFVSFNAIFAIDVWKNLSYRIL